MNAYSNLRAIVLGQIQTTGVFVAELADLLAEVEQLRAAAPVKKTRSKKPALVTMKCDAMPAWLPLDAWAAFLDMRKKIKKPATDYAQTLLIKKLAAFYANDLDPGVILNQSIMNGWQDLYAPKEASIGQRYDKTSGNAGRRGPAPETAEQKESRRTRWGLDGLLPAEGVIDAPY